MKERYGLRLLTKKKKVKDLDGYERIILEGTPLKLRAPKNDLIDLPLGQSPSNTEFYH